MNSSPRILRLIRKKVILFSAGLVLTLVVVNGALLLYNNHVQAQTTAITDETQRTKVLLNLIWDNVVRNIDLGVRGFALTKDDGLLLPYREGVRMYADYHPQLQTILQQQNFTQMQRFESVKKGYEAYIGFTAQLIELARADSMTLFTQSLKEDRGLVLWRIYEQFAKDVNAFEDQLSQEAIARYETTNTSMTYVQLLTVLIGVPTLLFMIFRIIRDEKVRKHLFAELETNNRQYIFDPGTSLAADNEREIIRHSIHHFQKAASFINQISTGNLQVDWEGISDQNRALNQRNLVGELIHMREKMKLLRQEDNKRMWSSEGLAQFSEIIRSYQHNMAQLCDQTLSFLVKYLSAQQGSLFVLQEQGDDKHLALLSCFAFDRKKFVEKRIEIGQGLVGQIYLEQESVMLTEIPQGYTAITSGLGDATPTCLLVIPMKYNDQVEAVIEIAGFQKYDTYHIEWLNKIGEIMASTLVSLKISEKTRLLLEQFQQQTEALRAQEEELRQNMEEMEATQEEMRRKEKELEQRNQQMQDLINGKSGDSE